MDKDRDPNRYNLGEIDAILRKADEVPPVHPFLIEHLRENFPRPIVQSWDPNEVFANNWFQAGAEAVLDYLDGLVHKGEDTPSTIQREKEQTKDVFYSPKAEGESPDPRRTRPGNGR